MTLSRSLIRRLGAKMSQKFKAVSQVALFTSKRQVNTGIKRWDDTVDQTWIDSPETILSKDDLVSFC